jgi:antitoxin YefM
MRSVSSAEFREDLAKYMTEVSTSHVPLRVTRPNGPAIVVLREEDYEGMLETIHLLQSPANAKRLLSSIKSAEAGASKERRLTKAVRAG